MTAVQVRSLLVEALCLDLVGPAENLGTPEEVLPEPPSRWYVTGFLVPLDADAAQRADETGADELDAVNDAKGLDDAVAPEPGPARRSYFPSSVGMSFLVKDKVKQVQVTVRWGDYKPERPADGGVLVQWRRIPRSEPIPLDVPTETSQPLEQDVPNSRGLKIAVSVRPVESDGKDGGIPKGTRSVSVFIVNRRKPAPDDERDTAFAFQAELELHSDEPFVARPNLRGLESQDWDECVADLQYCEDCEYAVGHNVSTDAILKGGKCNLLRTTWIPQAEVERVAPTKMEGVELSMDALGQFKDGAEAQRKLGPFVSQYRAWIDLQKAKIPNSPKKRRETAEELLKRARVAAGRIEQGIALLNDPVCLEAFRIAIGDIDWRYFVHSGESTCMRQLWMDERETSGDLSEVSIRCECKVQRQVSEAANLQLKALGHCDGSRPWLGPFTKESCGEPNRLLIRTASNAYFPQLMSVISLPDRDDTVKQAVDAAWEFLEGVEDIDQLKYERKKAKVKAALEGLSDEEAFTEILARRSGVMEEPKSVKRAELETLVASKETLENDKPDGNFFARTLPRDKWDQPWMKGIERIVLVHRLREVVAQVGFTRFEAASPDFEGELDVGVRRATLAREVSWLPAVENKGEGIFLQFRREEIESWLNRPEVQKRGRRLLAGFECWKSEHQGTTRDFPLLPYLMLHSFSHLLITAVSLECGYPASSIRERIYALPSVGYGVLLYTGSSDAEGTLGGLIEVGRRIPEHVRTGLDMGELCSNDPVCAQHQPEHAHEHRFLHGASCHGCLLIAETSCEQHNDFLDRALVVRTVDNRGTEFFRRASE